MTGELLRPPGVTLPFGADGLMTLVDSCQPENQTTRSRTLDTPMRTFHLHVEQTLDAPLEAVFRFFADASNLEAITPRLVGFKILTPRPIEMRVGTLIDYSIRLHGLPMRWRTRIDAWEPPDPSNRRARFVDTQLKGPYRVWIHEHTFEARPNPDGSESTHVTDHVEYAVPGGPGLERLIERWFVRPRIEQIFEYRKQAMEQCFHTPARHDGSPAAR